MGMFNPLALLEGIRKKFDDKKREVVTSRLLPGESEFGLGPESQILAEPKSLGRKIGETIFSGQAPGNSPLDIYDAMRRGVGPENPEGNAVLSSLAKLSSHPAFDLFGGGLGITPKSPKWKELAKDAVKIGADWLHPFETGGIHAYSPTPTIETALAADINALKYPTIAAESILEVHPRPTDRPGLGGYLTIKTDPPTAIVHPNPVVTKGSPGRNLFESAGVSGHERFHAISSKGHVTRNQPPNQLPIVKEVEGKIVPQTGGRPGFGDYVTSRRTQKELDELIGPFNRLYREGKSPLPEDKLSKVELKKFKKFQEGIQDAQGDAYAGQWEELKAQKAEKTSRKSFQDILKEVHRQEFEGASTLDLDALAIKGNPNYELAKKHKLISKTLAKKIEVRPETAPPIYLSDIFDVGTAVQKINAKGLPIRSIKGFHPDVPNVKVHGVYSPREAYWRAVSRELKNRGITENLPFKGPLD